MITYPVDVTNTRWAVYRISTGEILKRNQKWPRRDGLEIQKHDADYAFLLEVRADPPDYDQATQSLQRTEPVVDVENNTLTIGWEIIALPQDQIDAAAELAQIKAVYLDLKNGTGTTAQRLVRVERVLARLLKDTYGGTP